ncbi:MAG TPA: glycosyltransferase [Acidimicrobiia bacterium]|nr:glycosyltransferase [Acidimicrobiia bacterium]
MAVASMVSFRLGGPDGVSVQAATWALALERLGYSVRRVAGELADGARPGDVVVPGLAVAAEAAPGPAGQRPAAPEGPSVDELRAALEGSAVVVVENMLSLPLHLEAARVLTAVLADLPAETRVLLHHHDFAWQRPETASITELPPPLPRAVHVTINDFSRRELAERGIEAVTVRNAFHLDAPPGLRTETRDALGVGADDVLVLQPTRAIARKNIPASLRLAEGLAERLGRTVRYWLPGPAEDGYAATLADVLAATTVPVLRTHPGDLGFAMGDAYAACDLVVFPSTGGEGFGQPVIESVWADRPLAVLSYPALEEIVALGFSFLAADDPDGVAEALRRPDATTMARNRQLAGAHFSMTALERSLGALLRTR